MKRATAAHIRTLLNEARYIQQRREYAEVELSTDSDEEMDETPGKLQCIAVKRRSSTMLYF